jgi:predicted HTH transcriptional regulator
MINLNELNQYREGNRLEAKKAQGGLPSSLWETYSAFANTQGGVILLGVEEQEDKTLRAIGLPDPEKLVKEFWDAINNRQKVSVNILTDKHVRIVETDGHRIVLIEVFRANRVDKPVSIGAVYFSGTYRRNGEGDYHCTKDEVRNMLRDQSNVSQDLRVLEQLALDAFDYESVRRYRIRLQNTRPEHVWENLDDTEFLLKLACIGRTEDGALHPTAGGILMFGFEHEIIKEFSNYFLDYQEHDDDSTRWTDRIVSSTGEWSGNLFDFYTRVYGRLAQGVKTPFKLERDTRQDDTPVHKAVREALVNALIHANHYIGAVWSYIGGQTKSPSPTLAACESALMMPLSAVSPTHATSRLLKCSTSST